MNEKPIRIQLSRKKGWRMPENTVKVTRPGKWGNPFKIGDVDDFGEQMDASSVVECYRVYASMEPAIFEAARKELRGKNLACFCKLGAPCHADVLLELANEAPRVSR